MTAWFVRKVEVDLTRATGGSSEMEKDGPPPTSTGMALCSLNRVLELEPLSLSHGVVVLVSESWVRNYGVGIMESQSWIGTMGSVSWGLNHGSEP